MSDVVDVYCELVFDQMVDQVQDGLHDEREEDGGQPKHDKF